MYAAPHRIGFNLGLAALGLAVIAAGSAGSGWFLSRFLAEQMLQQEARHTMEFVDNIVRAERAAVYFLGSAERAGKEMRESFEHVSQLPDVLRANMYSRESKVIWSTEPALIGRRIENNQELHRALGGQLVAYRGARVKPEHGHLSTRYRFFLEVYSPVRDETNGEVIGVVELYRIPRGLLVDLGTSERVVWIAVACTGVFLYGALLVLLRRAAHPARIAPVQ